MTTIIEVSKSDFNKINEGKSTIIVHKLQRPARVGDTIIFQEIDDEGLHTNEEAKCTIGETVTDGLKAGYTAVAFSLVQH